VVAPFGISGGDLPDSMDLFMNYPYDCDLGSFSIKEPISRPGDYVQLRAEQDCLVAVSNCPEDLVSPCNAYHCTPVEVAVFDRSAEASSTKGDDPIEWLQEELEKRGLRPSTSPDISARSTQ
jgi:uncharacterized protein YcgI (DUF1989 family)